MESDVTPRTFWITLYKFFFPEIDYQNFGKHQEVRQLKIWQIDRGQLHSCVWENFFTFLSWLFGYEEKRPDKKVKINSKIMTLQSGQQIITIHISPNISRTKGNETWSVNKM